MPLRPSKEENVVKIPITFEYNGGKSSNIKYKIISSLVGVLMCIGVTVGLLYRDNGILTKFFLILGIWFIFLIFVRYIVFEELVYSDTYEALKEVDFKPQLSTIYGIYEIEREYPYVCHFVNGSKGVFVQLVRDVTVGKSEDVAYEHYKGVGDVLQYMYKLDITPYHIDYMDTVGNDPRLNNLYNGLGNVSNPDMQDLLLDIYDNLAYEMDQHYSTFDVYVLYTRNERPDFLEEVSTIAQMFVEKCNYISYKMLDAKANRDLCQVVFNLHNIDLKRVQEELLASGERELGIRVLSWTSPNGEEEVLRKSRAVEKREKEEREKEELERKRRVKEERHRERARKREEKKGRRK